MESLAIICENEQVTTQYEQALMELEKVKEERDALLKVIEEMKNHLKTSYNKKEKKKKEKAEVQKCPFTTAKGTECKKNCLPGEKSCKVHLNPTKHSMKVKKVRPVKVCCTGINIRGNPCKNKVIPGETFCIKHDPSLPKPEKKSARKKNKNTPFHNHKIGEEPMIPCQLCETHGDIFNPKVTESIWVSETEFYQKTMEVA